MLSVHAPAFHDPGLQPFGDEPEHTAVADPMLQEPHHPIMADAVEERPDVGVEDPVHRPLGDLEGERVQRIVLGTPRTEPVGKAEKIRLVDRVQHLHQRPLDDLVLERRDAERPLPAVGLRNVLPPRRLRPVAAAHHAAVQVVDVAIECARVLFPRHPVDAGSRPCLELMEGPGQQLRRHVVHQRREPFVPVPLRCFSYVGQRL